ncbi:hypothetical protein pipiens_012045 [Culex pipiens pipiens]|uniref:Uncharacterized protein n=1 Tax=Culex pipiens pipiens TaxID=38569 RepID=A0ABD1D3V5_CULPP
MIRILLKNLRNRFHGALPFKVNRMMPSGAGGSGPQQQQAPLPPQFRALMPPFRIATISVGRSTLVGTDERRPGQS